MEVGSVLSMVRVMELPILCFLFFNAFSSVETIPTYRNAIGDDSQVRFVTPFDSGLPLSKDEILFTDINAKTYLTSFGYMPLEMNVTYENALKTFQKFANIPQTGALDEMTIDKMMLPRCAIKDIVEDDFKDNHVRQKRYAIEGSYWGVKDITYQITRYTGELAPDKVDYIIEKSFKVWEEYSPLRFIKRNHGPVNIEIMFANKAHGDGEPFDGRGGILAHAFFPRYGGDVHFDDDEPWRSPDNRGIDLYSVAAHEIGHSLGLKHSQSTQALMAPFYQGYSGDTITLQPDDVKGIQHLYGRPEERVDASDNDLGATDKPSLKENFLPNKKPFIPSAGFNICDDPSLDAMTTLGNGSTYAYKGDLYWRLNQISYDEGYPRNITNDWDGLPGGIDAAVTDYDGDTYFFKNDMYWLYDSNGRRYPGYPRKISAGLVDTPDNIDSAMIWNYDDKPYFFKADKYWQYSRWGMQASWPRSTKDISPIVPEKIDAALKWNNGKTYIFAGPYYYRVTGWRVMKLVTGYPRLTGEWWFGCGGNNKQEPTRAKRSSSSIDYSDK